MGNAPQSVPNPNQPMRSGPKQPCRLWATIDIQDSLRTHCFAGLFDKTTVCWNTYSDNRLIVVGKANQWFADIVDKLRLDHDAADLRLEFLSCFELEYPQGAPPGWIAATIDIW